MRAYVSLQVAALPGVRAWLVDQIFAERDRWALWLPVGIGVGVSAYFALPIEPAGWLGAALLVVVLAIGVASRRWPPAILVALALGSVALGFAAAKWRVIQVTAPVLQQRLNAVEVRGRVVSLEARTDGGRILVQPIAIGDLSADQLPALVRVRVRGDRAKLHAIAAPGAWLRMRATLSPPSAPAAPDTFDFARLAWFQRIGAVGFGFGLPESIEAPPGFDTESSSWWLAVESLRHAVFTRVTRAQPNDGGAIAAALMMGERGAISEPVLAAMRDAGLAHLLAISGLHIGLVAGLAFFAVRAGLALAPSIALRRPIKKWAALAAAIAALGYLTIAGAPVPTQRAYLMAGLVLIGIALDRRALSMRLVAWAAAVILLLRPESLLGASFQLSFAAVVALIAAYECIGPRWSGWRRGASLPRRIALYLAAVALTSLVAGLATGVIGLFSFQRVVAYGLFANMIAVPLTASWVMPWAMLAYALMPLGLEGWALQPMVWGIDAILAVARAVSAWPGAVHLLPGAPAVALVGCTLGGLWLCLWRRPWRLAGLALIAAGLAAMPAAPRPDLVVSDDGQLVAIRASDGRLLFSDGRRGRFEREMWLRREGHDAWGTFADDGAAAGLACDRLGCIFRAAAMTIAVIVDERALAEDCRAADVLISAVPVRRYCPRPRLVIDRFDVWRYGAHAVWLDAAGPRAISVAQIRGERPWAPAREWRSDDRQ